MRRFGHVAAALAALAAVGVTAQEVAPGVVVEQSPATSGQKARPEPRKDSKREIRRTGRLGGFFAFSGGPRAPWIKADGRYLPQVLRSLPRSAR